MENKKEYLINFDGGAAPTNPGPSAYGFVIYEIINSELDPIYASGDYIDIQTNNFAEYSGVLNGIKYFKNNLFKINDQNVYTLSIKGDSKLVVEQLNGKWKCESSNIIDLYKECKKYIQQLKMEGVNININHVYRIDNKKADSICNYCIENKRNYEEIFLE